MIPESGSRVQDEESDEGGRAKGRPRLPVGRVTRSRPGEGERLPQQVKVVVDSTADIPHNLAEELDITVVPLTVHFGDQSYRDWTELTPLEFYDLLETSPHHPYTSPPTPEEFATVYESLTADGSAVVSLHISAELSETYAAAKAAQAMLGDRGRVEVIDSRVVSIAFGVPAIDVAAAARDGKSFEEVTGLARSLLAASAGRAFFTVDTLEYLVRNGRIGRAQAILGTLLAVKPVLTFTDGLIAPYEKVRGDRKVVPRMIDIMRGLLGAGKPARTAIVHANALDRANELREAMREAFGVDDTLICDLGSVVGTHGGPGTLGMVFY